MHHPFPMIAAGPTGSGKTTLIRKFLSEYSDRTTFNGDPKVLWCYGIYTEDYSKPIDNSVVKYFNGIPSMDIIKGNDVIVLDDLMSDATNSKRIAELFTRGCHHLKISLIFITQNVFNKGKEARDISLNVWYTILMKNPRDKQQAMFLGRQLMGTDWKCFVEAYNKAISRSRHGYLFIDTSPYCDDDKRLRTRILASEFINAEACPIFYKKCNQITSNKSSLSSGKSKEQKGEEQKKQ